ncbi:MAG TPA: L-histidine N(alpha)-methyltransferase [Candidatus Sulfotelmatobacter sp.]|nr:L-histidine N(alpha)-methyltransferase [Candidatus Sulfotelmatobacter sp.]
MAQIHRLERLQDLSPTTGQFRAAVLDGLAQSAKRLPCKFFYDAEGSRLFDAICELPEYYPTRTECRILEARAGELAALLGRKVRLIEFGSGAGYKIRLLLRALAEPAAYVPVDISRGQLLTAATSLAREFAALHIAPVCADYTQPFSLPGSTAKGALATAGFFPGSTIGNFTPDQAWHFLAQSRRLLGSRAWMIVGVDLHKDAAVLDAAYNDAAGVTAAFNLNLLRRINRELDGTFDLAAFRHRAFYNEPERRIEMHLVSLRAQTVAVGGELFAFAEGETIHTEDSYKYAIADFQSVATRAGFEPVVAWTDPDELFSIHVLRAR